MISIITPGKVPDDRKKLKCERCSCIFYFSREDIKADDRPCAMPYVMCPTQGCSTRVDPSIIQS